ncbi:MAG: DUF2220 family protein [Gammaproteobacteria bacterium]|nr:DUF2220 family protein [Gammaproteobacteria bacterium]
MSLKQYLDKIKAGKPINFTRFINLLPSFYEKQKRDLFSVSLQSPQKWIVSCSLEVFQELEKLAKVPENRIEAAAMGNSHRAKVSSGFLLVYHQNLSDSRPDVVYLEQESYLQCFQSKKYLLIVENEENFFLSNSMLKLASIFTNQQIDLTNTDIVLGSGTRVTSRLAQSWYQQYDSILCAFDYDLAGLKMYRTLQANLGEQVHFLQPQNYSQYEPYFKMKPKTHPQLMECIKLAQQLGFEALANCIKKQRMFMEQEMLLMEIDNG